jgi:hypothetical protein
MIPADSSYYYIAGITLEVNSDLPIRENTFHKQFEEFRTATPCEDVIRFYHHFSIPGIDRGALGKQVYDKAPWAIYHDGESWTYLGVFPGEGSRYHRVAVFNKDHTLGHIFSPDESAFRRGNLSSLTLSPTDQIVMARILSDRRACYLHAAGMILHGHGVVFVGHSGAGKSTMVTMLRKEGEILCDDRVIVRRWPGGFRVHGSWSHGEVPDVSASDAPLRAIFFLEKSDTNQILPVPDRKACVRMLPFYIVKPLATADWWEKTLDLVEEIAREVPVFILKFDQSGAVKDLLRDALEEVNLRDGTGQGAG